MIFFAYADASQDPRVGRARERWFAVDPPQTHTERRALHNEVTAFVEKYRERHPGGGSVLLPFFGEKRLGAITREEIDSFLVSGQMARAHHPKQKKLVEPLSPTMNYCLSVLRFIFRDAVARGLVTTNPAARAKPLKNPSRRKDVCSTSPRHRSTSSSQSPKNRSGPSTA